MKNTDKEFKEMCKKLPKEIIDIMKENNINSLAELLEFIEKNSAELENSENEEIDIFDTKQYNTNFFINETPIEYHLRVKLNNSPISIWREVKVPSNITLEFLACIINKLMGWTGYHMHQFVINGIFYKNTELLTADADFILPFSPEIQKRDSNHYAISEIFTEKGKRIKYEYDFGDGWVHDIWLKGMRQYEANEEISLKVVKGQGMDTIEDCGGVWGLYNIINILSKKRKTADEKDLLKWYDIDPKIDIEYFNQELAQKYLDQLWNKALFSLNNKKENNDTTPIEYN